MAIQEYQQFETNPTLLTLSIPSLFLFNCWKVMKIYGGQMKFDIEKSSAQGKEPDRTFVTIDLPRYAESADLNLPST
jgi:hypothetical protein